MILDDDRIFYTSGLASKIQLSKGSTQMVKLIGLVGTNSKNQQTVNYYNTFKTFFRTVEIELVEIKDIPMFNKPTPK